MNTAAQQTPSINSDIIKKLFDKFSKEYGKLWSNKHSTQNEWDEQSKLWLSRLENFDISVVREALKSSLIIHKPFPPSLFQFLELCLIKSGVPSLQNAIKLISKGDINHPVVLELYKKIDPWALKMAKEAESIKMATQAYGETISLLLSHPKEVFDRFEKYKNQELSNIEDKKTVNLSKFGYKEHKKKLDEFIKNNKISHPNWDIQKVTIGSKNFDSTTFYERKKYLLSLSEYEASTLTHREIYDRLKFIGEIEAKKIMKKLDQSNEKKINNTPIKSYRHWADDR